MATPSSLKEEKDPHPASLPESTPGFRLLTAAPRLRELTGAVDLLNYYGLREHYETYCKKDLPLAVSDSHYLLNVVGDTEIRKGEGMELGELLQGSADTEISHMHIKPFNFDVLWQAFSFRESGPIFLPEAERGTPTISGKIRDEYKDKERKHGKHKKHKEHKDRHKDKDKHKDRGKFKEKEKDHSKMRENGEKHHKKKRKHGGEENEAKGHKHKKKKHKHSSKTEKQDLAKK